MIKTKIINSIQKVIAEKTDVDINQFDFYLEIPKEKKFGDLSSNIAMQLPKYLKKPPRKIAEEIVERLEFEGDWVKNVDIAGPGFINFYISDTYYQNQLSIILSHEDFGRLEHGVGKKVQVEFVSANPTGPLSVGHGRQAVWGDTVANILQNAGYDVDREYYFNDAGNQMKVLGESTRLRYLELLGEEIEFLEDGYQGEYIVEIAEKIKTEYGDSKRYEGWEFFKEFAEAEIFADIKSTLKRLGIVFDNYFNEKSLYDNGKIDYVLQEFEKKDLAYQSEGAVWFKATEFGSDKDRVIIKSSGEPTYRLPDIAYHTTKFDRSYDKIIDIFGADHHSTYPDVLAGLEALGYDTSPITVLINQFVTLIQDGKKVKMSTRKANFVTLDELMDDVGVDVARYFFLMRSMTSHLNFDLDLARSETEENPVYYVQYAHARICSMIEFGKEKGVELPDVEDIDLTLLSEEEELNLIKQLLLFPEIVESVLQSYEPYQICKYLEEVATLFHKFYHNHKVISDDDLNLTNARLILSKATQVILRKGLNLLGINAPQKM